MLLKGIIVLDLSNLFPGPMCSLFLADLGAKVLKIESLEGDFLRTVSDNGKTPYFCALNRNKKSIAIDLKTKEGKRVFLTLSKKADVIIEGFRPGKMKALGLGYDAIKKINQKIIYCSISGYGQNGIYKDKAGHDLNYCAQSGLLDLLSKDPFVPGVQIADASCAMICAFSIVSALFHKEKSGKGNYIDASIFKSTFPLISMHLATKSVSGNESVLSGEMPCYNLYETKDGKLLSLCAIEKKFWNAFCTALRKQELLEKQFDSSLVFGLRRIFMGKNLAEWVKLNKKFDFCCEPVSKAEEVIKDKNLMKSNVLVGFEGLTQSFMPVLFSSFKKIKLTESPKLGEHTKNILSSAGYSEKAIKDLINKKIVLDFHKKIYKLT